MKQLLLAITAAAAAIVLAACGGGSDPLSKAEFVKQANVVCADVNKKVDAIKAPDDFAGKNAYVDKIKPLVDDGIKRLEDITPPGDAKDDYDALLDLSRDQRGLIDELKAADSEAAANPVIEKGNKLDDQGDVKAKALGLTECLSDDAKASQKEPAAEAPPAETPTGEQLTEEELVTQANKICTEVEAQISDLGGAESIESIAKVAPDVAKFATAGMKRLDAMIPPNSLATQWGTFVGSQQVSTDLITDLGAAAKAGDQKALESVVTQSEAVQKQVDKAAGKLGLTECVG